MSGRKSSKPRSAGHGNAFHLLPGNRGRLKLEIVAFNDRASLKENSTGPPGMKPVHPCPRQSGHPKDQGMNSSTEGRFGFLSRRGVRSPQDLAGGLFLLLLAVIAYLGALDLDLGRLAAIGPGMLPKVMAGMI